MSAAEVVPHTPAPWTVDLDAICAQGQHLAVAIGIEGSSWAQQKANAARIVACVNACAGMADPVAAVEAFHESLDRARGQRDAALEQNAELLAAYERILDSLNDDHQDCSICDCAEGTPHDPESACGALQAAITATSINCTSLPPRIVVVVEGGVVQEVCCDTQARYLVVDHDNIKAGNEFEPVFEEIEAEPLHVAAFAAGKQNGLSE